MYDETKMIKLKQVTPLVPVEDVSKSSEFFENVLGFNAIVTNETYAYLKRDNVALRLQRAGSDVGQQACYIDVENLDKLYEELKPELQKLPNGRVRPPFNQNYGQREFHVTDMDNLLIFFGEPIK